MEDVLTQTVVSGRAPTNFGHIRPVSFQEFKSDDEDEVGQISATAFDPEAWRRNETPSCREGLYALETSHRAPCLKGLHIQRVT